jgi:hypothetical protein
MDDHQRYWDFWLNLNHGWDHINYVHKFEEYWGKGSYPPEKIVLPAKDFDALVERINNPEPEQIESLRKLMSKKSPWDKKQQ